MAEVVERQRDVRIVPQIAHFDTPGRAENVDAGAVPEKAYGHSMGATIWTNCRQIGELFLAQLAGYALPRIDFTMTSPPCMQRDDPENPLAAYQEPGRGYAAYLADLQAIYRQIGLLMTESARAVVEVANLKKAGAVTTLAWDVAHAISQVLHFEGEIVVAWEPTYGYGYDHSYCLLFTRPPD